MDLWGRGPNLRHVPFPWKGDDWQDQPTWRTGARLLEKRLRVL